MVDNETNRAISQMFPKAFRERREMNIIKTGVNFKINNKHHTNVMVDPSILLNPKKIKKIGIIIKENPNNFTFYIPSSFVKILHLSSTLQNIDQRKNESKLDYSEWKHYLKFFRITNQYSQKTIIELLETVDFQHEIFDKEKFVVKYDIFYKNLSKSKLDQSIIELIFEEWVFMQEHSWIISSSKRNFEIIKKCGTKSLEFSKTLVNIFLKSYNEIKFDLEIKIVEVIDILKKLGKVAKWIATIVDTFSDPFDTISDSLKNEWIWLLKIGLASKNLLILFDPNPNERLVSPSLV